MRTLVIGAQVTAFDRDLRKNQVLGKVVTTDNRGEYTIPYKTSDFQRADRKLRPMPWLIVEVKTSDGSPAVSVEKQKDVSRIETLDIQLGVRLNNEWERISTAVQPLLEGQGDDATGKTALLPHDIASSDFDFLEIETGFDKEALEA